MSGTHYKGPVISYEGFGMGDKYNEITIIDSTGTVNSRLKVKAGEALTKGQLVYISGYDADSELIKVKKADADGADPAKAALFVVPEDIGNGETGYVVGMYEVDGVDTSSLSVGDPVYLSTTAGGWSGTAPASGGSSIQHVGVVTASDATNGKILFFPFYSKVVTVNTTA